MTAPSTGSDGTRRRVGFIGLGHMGAPMCGRLVEAGFAVTVYNRSPDKARPFAERGARVADTPADAAGRADVVLSMVADDAALLDVALGERGVLAGARPGLIYADMSTVSPEASARVAEACAAAGVDYLRAPVTGSTTLAAAGTLGILVSGPRERYEEALDVFRVLGQQQFYLGPAEEARVMKLAVNTMVGTTMAALAEALVLGEKAGLDWRQMLEVFPNTAVGSPFVKYKAGPLAERSFAPAFTASLMAKDFDLALETARRLGVAAPVTGLVRQLLQATNSSGWGERDMSALVLLLEQLAGLPPRDATEPPAVGDQQSGASSRG